MQNVWTVGRSPSCDIVVNDEYADLYQCDLIRVISTGQVFVVDRGSTNPIKVHHVPDAPIRVRGVKEIFPGDILMIGYTNIKCDPPLVETRRIYNAGVATVGLRK